MQQQQEQQQQISVIRTKRKTIQYHTILYRHKTKQYSTTATRINQRLIRTYRKTIQLKTQTIKIQRYTDTQNNVQQEQHRVTRTHKTMLYRHTQIESIKTIHNYTYHYTNYHTQVDTVYQTHKSDTVPGAYPGILVGGGFFFQRHGVWGPSGRSPRKLLNFNDFRSEKPYN